MNRYIVAVSGLSDDEEKQFIQFLEKKGLGWWHWIQNFWLVVDSSNRTSATEIRTLLKDIAGSRRGIVIQNPSFETWAGFSEANKSKAMFDWVHRNWKP